MQNLFYENIMYLPESFPQNIYQAYSYSYPHKSAYRNFESAIPIEEVWRKEKKDALFLYLHIPFCEMRCGFCNLFTVAKPAKDIVNEYIDALERQTKVVAKSIGEHQFVRYAVGGGTPTFLELEELKRIHEIINTNLNLMKDIPFSIETSPETITKDKINFFGETNVQRISIGVQSFIGNELSTLIRRQKMNEVVQALDLIKSSTVPVLNVDLIYGIEGQTLHSWMKSLQAVVEFSPEEVYLYPLYLREKTGMDIVIQRENKIHIRDENSKLSMYEKAREFLIDNNYQQISMRMFRKNNLKLNEGPVYCCQSDGMLGLGAGARSYTKNVHYCSEYAVSRKNVKSIIRDYNKMSFDDFNRTTYGFALTQNEQKHRHLIQSLLHIDGFSFSDYTNRFDSSPLDEFPQLSELVDYDLAFYDNTKKLKLTAKGIAHSDAIGPWLISKNVKQLMTEYQVS